MANSVMSSITVGYTVNSVFKTYVMLLRLASATMVLDCDLDNGLYHSSVYKALNVLPCICPMPV
jgi:hypothetical protein